MRHDGLECSEKMLNEDIRSFVDFFRGNSENCDLAVREAEEKQKEKQKKVLDLKLLYDEIQIVLSTINRNLENLNEYYGYKELLDSISSKEFQEKQQSSSNIKKLVNKQD